MSRNRVVRIQTVPSPVGPLQVASFNGAVVALTMSEWRDGAFKRWLAERAAADVVEESDPVLAKAAKQLQQYFEGRRTTFDVPIEFPWGTPFQRRVWKNLLGIPYGETRSYGWIAERAKAPGGSRAAGQALGANPVGIIVPCHRVVRSDGAIGGYGGGLDAKRELLTLEGARFKDT